jgi:hypothetical protein
LHQAFYFTSFQSIREGTMPTLVVFFFLFTF